MSLLRQPRRFRESPANRLCRKFLSPEPASISIAFCDAIALQKALQNVYQILESGTEYDEGAASPDYTPKGIPTCIGIWTVQFLASSAPPIRWPPTTSTPMKSENITIARKTNPAMVK